MKIANDTQDEPELKRLIGAARQGDEEAMRALRVRQADPALWRRVGDLAAHVEAELIRTAAGDDLVLAEGLSRSLDALRGELGHPSATRIERLLIERVALSWLETQYLDALAARRGVSASPEARELDRRRVTAQQRYLAALKQLPLVRRLLGRAGTRKGVKS